MIADLLIKKSYPLYFYKNETQKKELDFLIQREGRVTPIEVKSANSKAASLNMVMKQHPEITEGYKLIDGNVGMGENRIVSIPLYMAMFL